MSKRWRATCLEGAGEVKEKVQDMTPEFVRRHTYPVPRYTSYPTAPHFSGAIQPAHYVDWLGRLDSRSRLSLYVHIPFCRSLCWYCGCTTKAIKRYDPVNSYLGALTDEISNVAALLPETLAVTHLHWGGGSPNILEAGDILRLSAALREKFRMAEGMEFAIEIDPRDLVPDQIDALARSGANRVSIGVQDFDADVQSAINRVQSYETTKRAVDLVRSAGVRSVNIDLVYGLPHQTRASLTRTIEQVLTLRPDRIAVFGYAHLPERIRHQRLIDTRSLPGAVERYAQSQRLARHLAASGYVQIGIDHFALASDPLSLRVPRRNFQGYTTDDADALIGLGSSAIGQLPEGYVQNAQSAGEYQARIRDIGLATVRGVKLTDDDRLRACAIESLMCAFTLSGTDLRRRFGDAAQPLLDEAEAIIEADRDGLVARTPDGFRVTARGRPFVRTICACFDRHWSRGPAQHALAV